MTFKSGFVAILGRPNRSQPFESRHGAKDCYHEDKAQTTRTIMGIYTTGYEQIKPSYRDTPNS